MKQYKFGAVIVREGKWFVARCLQLPVTSQGRTLAKAKANLEEALALYLKSFGPSRPLRAALRPSKGGDEDLQASPEELTLTTLTVTTLMPRLPSPCGRDLLRTSGKRSAFPLASRTRTCYPHR